ncbi:MAG: VWA domain-containing protein [Planctomycetia bacterium]|nr:VWA domain-containing protein [Planctomycetia bacterium]
MRRTPITHVHSFETDSARDWREWLSTWGISFLFHVLLFSALALSLSSQVTNSGGAESEKTADVQVAFKKREGEKVVYETFSQEDETTGESNDTNPAAPVESADAMGALAGLMSEAQAPDVPEAILDRAGMMPVEGSGGGGIGSAADVEGVAIGTPGGMFDGFGKGKVTCFNTTGEGNRFAFVFDRSGSMGGAPILAAKTELVKCLNSLQSNQQFLIIFYNHEYVAFPPAKLILATERNRQEAFRFLSSVTADGGTESFEPLTLAVSLHPDVIFFLTDAEDVSFSAAELQAIRKAAAGTQINTIQFGMGPQPTRENFLTRLARENEGQYIYVDVTQMKRGRGR